MNFNEISGKNVTYDDVESDKKSKAWHFLQTAYFLKHIFRIKVQIFLNETSILALDKLAIFILFK